MTDWYSCGTAGHLGALLFRCGICPRICNLGRTGSPRHTAGIRGLDLKKSPPHRPPNLRAKSRPLIFSLGRGRLASEETSRAVPVFTHKINDRDDGCTRDSLALLFSSRSLALLALAPCTLPPRVHRHWWATLGLPLIVARSLFSYRLSARRRLSRRLVLLLPLLHTSAAGRR